MWSAAHECWPWTVVMLSTRFTTAALSSRRYPLWHSLRYSVLFDY